MSRLLTIGRPFFVASMVVALVSLLSLIVTMYLLNADQLVIMEWYHYAFCMTLIVHVLIGIYGAVAKNWLVLRVFVYMSFALYLVIFCFGLAPNVYIWLAKYLVNANSHMRLYSWDQSVYELQGRSKFVTRDWDLLQALGCCGFQGPEDWNKFRPADLEQDQYPPSCCSYSIGGPKFACRDRAPDFSYLGCQSRISIVAGYISMGAALLVFVIAVYNAIALDLCVRFRRDLTKSVSDIDLLKI